MIARHDERNEDQLRRRLDGMRCLVAFAILAALTVAIFHPGAESAGQGGATAGQATPYLTYDPATRTISYETADRDTNGLVCVTGTATGGRETLFTYNGHGFGSATATFQTNGGGANTNTYRLYKGAVFAGTLPTNTSCGTGTFVMATTVTT
jgi:hypothetical protein